MTRGRGLVARALALALVAAAVAACGGGGDGAAAGGGAGAPAGTVTVFAAASLTDAVTELAAAFEADHPGTEVTLNLAGSSALAAGILEGAPADVLAAADPAIVEELVDVGVARPGVPFARTTLEIAVPPGNPGDVAGLADFARDDLLLGLCAPQVPCGAAARQALASAGVSPAPDTNEPDVRALVTKVAAGELDAGIVYRADVVAAAGAVDAVVVAPDHDVAVTYPVAVLDEAPNPEAAAAFVELLLGAEGRRVLGRWGFLVP